MVQNATNTTTTRIKDVVSCDRQKMPAVFRFIRTLSNIFTFAAAVLRIRVGKRGTFRKIVRIKKRIFNLLEHAMNKGYFPCGSCSVKLPVTKRKGIFIFRCILQREIPPECPRALCKVLHAVASREGILPGDFIHVPEDECTIGIFPVVLVGCSEHSDIHGRGELVQVAENVLKLIRLVV